MSKHIRTLEVQSFRGLQKLCIKDLAPINIFTGDNNSGKTSILELIESLDAPGNLSMWRSLIRKERFSPLSFGLSFYEGLINLFNVDDEDLRISYEVEFTNGEKDQIELVGKINEEVLSGKEIYEMTGFSYDEEEEGEEESENVEKFTLQILLNGNVIAQNEMYDIERRSRLEKQEDLKLVDVTYISPVRHTEGTVFLNSVLDNPELYEQMIQILQEFDPGIISINVDNANEKFRRGNVYKILSKNHSKALPLNVYGDGMKKALLLMSAVIKTKGGVLLLDEFETAIHTTAMDTTFKWILETCVRLDVQLFLTTHSEEAIDKVLKCSPELQDKIKVFTLYKNDKETVVRALTAHKAIEIKDEMGLELR